MLNPYHKKMNIQEILNVQKYQYQQAIYLEQEIPADEELDASVAITALGHFMLLSMTGSFTTKEGQSEDNGITECSMQLIDGSNHRELFDDFIPCNLFLSPGRIQALAGVGTASNQLFLEYPFVYTFVLNGAILVKLRNTAAFANTVRIMFKGIRIFPRNRNEQ